MTDLFALNSQHSFIIVKLSTIIKVLKVMYLSTLNYSSYGIEQESIHEEIICIVNEYYGL